MTTFDVQTALTPLGEGRFAGAISSDWLIGSGPNGGCLAALILRGLQVMAGDDVDPRSLTLHYLAPPEVGPCEVAVAVERAGRTTSRLSARLLQEGRLCVVALAAFARPRTSMEFVEMCMPDAPAPEDAAPLSSAAGPGFWNYYEMRMALGGPLFSGSKEKRAGGWLRLREPRPADALFLAALTDAWFPQVYTRLTAPAFAPTIDLTMHFRAYLPLAQARPDDWYLLVVSTGLATEGFLEEDAEVWSHDGHLLAQSRQLALAPASAG